MSSQMKQKVQEYMQLKRQKRPLKWSMISMLLFCWLLPITLLALCMLFFVTNKMNNQIEKTVKMSANKAMEICQMRIDDAISVSRSASYMPNIRNAYLDYKKHGNKQQLHNEVTSFLTQQYRYDINFLSTMLYFTDDPDVVCYTYRNSKESTYYSVLQFINSRIRTVRELAETMDTEVAFVNVKDHIYMVRNMMGNDFKPYAVIVMELNKESIFDSLENVWGYKTAEIYIDDEPVLKSDFSVDINSKNLQRTYGESIYRRGDAAAWVYQVNRVEKQNISYVVELELETLISELDAVRYVFAILMIFMIPLIFLVLFFFHKKITKPIDSLAKATHKIAEGNYGEQISEINSSREFYYLSQAFNGMSTKLRDQFEKIYSEELALRDANIMALQSQINPHFLNNTLEIINWEARMMDNYKVSGMIEALSTMLEATMNRKKQQLITLSEELSYVDAYLFIIGQRFGEKFQVEKNIDKNLLRVEVPRLIIQPIIENAVEHGMDIQKRGRVRINIYPVDDKMHIEIIDNGKLTEENLKKISMLLKSKIDTKDINSTSLGIRNVNQRLKIIYGEDCGLTIESNEENNTVSTLIIKIERDTNVAKTENREVSL